MRLVAVLLSLYAPVPCQKTIPAILYTAVQKKVSYRTSMEVMETRRKLHKLILRVEFIDFGREAVADFETTQGCLQGTSSSLLGELDLVLKVWERKFPARHRLLLRRQCERLGAQMMKNCLLSLQLGLVYRHHCRHDMVRSEDLKGILEQEIERHLPCK